MVIEIQSLAEISGKFDAIVFDQWGVLHDGSVAYPGVPQALERLAAGGTRLAVLSNSGKRASANASRITARGYRAGLFAAVMTSGEALWRDLSSGRLAGIERFCAVASAPGDARDWLMGLDGVRLVDRLDDADCLLLMGLSDNEPRTDVEHLLLRARQLDVPVICSNPDHASPRAGGKIVRSIGALAREHEAAGGRVTYYGKPYPMVFDRLAMDLGSSPSRLLMVGDSLDHDIAGAHAAGWKTVFVQGGIHADLFAGGEQTDKVRNLAASKGTPEPDFTIALAA